MKLLENKIAIVTGAARGIGEAIVETFAEQGAAIAFSYVSDRSAEKAEAVALIPPLALSLGDTMQRNAESFPSLQDVSKAYEETE